jgi:uncharacterized protein YjbI with pentapeptide repeats
MNKKRNEIDLRYRIIIALFLGIIIGTILAMVGLRTIADHIQTILILFVAFLILFSLVIVGFIYYKKTILKYIFGISDEDIEDLSSNSQDLIQNISDKDYDEAKRNANTILKKGASWFFWLQYRRWIILVFQVLFVGFGGLLGSILLFNQNILINQQNERIDKQNLLIERQNTRLDQQTYLQEAERRSSLVFLLGNILDKIGEELQKKEVGDIRDLTPELIARISSISFAFKPYKYLKNGELIKNPLSPERGQLLLTLVNSNIDENTLNFIYKSSNFQYSDLQNVNFENAYLKNIDLSYANIDFANLENTNFENAIMRNATFRNCKSFSYTNFTNAKLDSCTFHNSNKYVNLNTAILRRSKLKYAVFTGKWEIRNNYTLNENNWVNSSIDSIDFSKSKITNANFDSAYIKKMILEESLVNTVDFTYSKYDLLNLKKASIINVDFRWIAFNEVILDSTKFDSIKVVSKEIFKRKFNSKVRDSKQIDELINKLEIVKLKDKWGNLEKLVLVK